MRKKLFLKNATGHRILKIVIWTAGSISISIRRLADVKNLHSAAAAAILSEDLILLKNVNQNVNEVMLAFLIPEML